VTIAIFPSALTATSCGINPVCTVPTTFKVAGSTIASTLSCLFNTSSAGLGVAFACPQAPAHNPAIPNAIKPVATIRFRFLRTMILPPSFQFSAIPQRPTFYLTAIWSAEAQLPLYDHNPATQQHNRAPPVPPTDYRLLITDHRESSPHLPAHNPL